MDQLNERSYFQSKRKMYSSNVCDGSSAETASAPSSSQKCSASFSKVATGYSSSSFPKGYLAVAVILVVIALQVSTARSATLSKRSTDQVEEFCRNNAICGWEVYDRSSRNLQYYVASSCKCVPSKAVCIRAEDDVSISAYVFRCREQKRRTTPLPSVESNVV